MDYKELVENLKEWHRTICKMCGDDILTCDDLCGCTGDCIVVQAITAITDLLTENQALRNAANGFKKQLEAAEARAEKAERERDYAIKQLKIAADENGGCWGCKWFDDMTEKCTNPEGVVYCNTRTNNMWEWRGLKEE